MVEVHLKKGVVENWTSGLVVTARPEAAHTLVMCVSVEGGGIHMQHYIHSKNEGESLRRNMYDLKVGQVRG